jgi:type II secretory pathway pseudopilin PulG
MSARRWKSQLGFTLLELLVSVAAGLLVVGGLSFLYVATVRALDESSSQAALQRTGALALQAITRQAQWATQISLTCSNPAAPGGTTGRTFEIYVTDTAPSTIFDPVSNPDPIVSLPEAQTGYYCFYAGNGSNGAAAGALCQRFTPRPVGGDLGSPGPCWNLLAAPPPGVYRPSGGPPGLSLIQQTSPASPFCPANTDGTAIANGQYCFALNQTSVPGSSQVTADIAFAITDNPTDPSRGMTFTASLMKRN